MCIQFTSEKALEDYICENNALDDYFHNEFKRFNLIGIEFIGRQVRLDNSHIIDLLYYCDVKKNNKLLRLLIVVELKNVTAKAKDLCQLSRYTGLLGECIKTKDIFDDIENLDEICIFGYLVAPAFSEELTDLLASHNLKEHIRCVNIIHNLEFKTASYSWKDEYIKELKLDERIIKTLKE